MKIFHFNYCLAQGGAERFMIDLANIQSLNHDVSLFILRDDSSESQGFFKSEISKNIRYINLNISPGFKLSLITRFDKILKKNSPDVVHVHLDIVNYFFPLSVKYRKRIKFIYTIHSHAKVEVKSFPEKLIRSFFFRHNLVTPVAISEETKISSESYYGLKDLKVIYNGRSFSGKSGFFEKVKDEVTLLKPDKGTLVFCHLARFHPLKNQKMLVTVFNRLRSEGFNIILLIIGSGFEDEKQLLSMAGDHIHFLGSKANVMDYLFLSDAFCLSSLSEGMPISLIESLACGCVPICTPVGGIINTIQNGITGFISESTSEEDYIVSVRSFIIDRDKIDRTKLVDYYRENFSMERCNQSYLELYRESLSDINAET